MSSGEHLGYDRDRLTVVRRPWLGGDVLSYGDPRPHDVLDVLDLAVHRHPSAVAVLDAATGASRTTTELADDVAATARRWQAEGLRPGDGVGIAAGNSGDHLVALLACAAAGAVAVGLSSRLAVPQWRYQLEHSGCRLLLHDDAHAEQAARAADGLADLRSVGSPGRRAATGAGTGAGAGAGADDAAGGGPGAWARWRATRAPVPATTAYQVVHTSGSTGHPKASQVVHGASVSSGIAYDRLLRLQPGESSGVLFSLGYISAMHAHVIPALLSGVRLVMLPTGSPRTWVEQLAAFDVAWAYAVPSWWLLALREPGLRAAALPRLRLAGAGGSPFPDALRDGLAQRLPGTELLNVYGLSETHSPATVLRGADLWTHAGTAGRALEVVEVEVRDAQQALRPDGEPGEVWLRSALVTTGYAGDPDATTAAVVAGALRTGDVGVLEPGGPDGPVLRLLDRVKDLVNRAGTKVYSAEVERVLDEHPALAEAACVAAPDPRSGETVAVFLVLAEGHERPTDAQVRAWVRERLGTAAVPSALRWVDALPRGGTGKTDKLDLRARLAVPPDPRVAGH
ncbi:class I adenylate-forming enzyme family protein [Aquipuribacter sp. MA13-6]|uniref:class I adenylate-forming enzyme family protein n=1 Tax=unclassified Aquipuribacter TaxID=2635084 RepID=UPI003EE8B7F8